VKENSLQIVDGEEWQDSWMLGADGMPGGPHMQSLEKNITDIDSADLDRDLRIDEEEAGDPIDISIMNESQKIGLQKMQTGAEKKAENVESI